MFKKEFHRALCCYFLLILYVIWSTRDIKRNYHKNNLRQVEIPSLIQYVDVFYGTGVTNSNKESTGNLFPIAARPFGNNHWTITTNGKSPWFFDRDSSKFYGIRCSHQPSAWIGDYAFFDMSPSLKPIKNVKYEMTPSVINVLFDNDSSIRLIPTSVGAVMTFKEIDQMNFKKLKYKIIDDYTVVGTATETSIFKSPDHTKLHVVIMSNTNLKNRLRVTDSTIWRIGTSFISETQAFMNVPTNDPESILATNDRIWNNMLSRIIVSGRTEQLEKFYSILYKTLLFPRMLKEPSGKHYSPYSKYGSTRDGELSTDSGFWDAYRTVYPFLNLVYPEYAAKILNGWINSIKESPDSMLPQWSSPAKVDSMEGSMGEISIAEGIMNDSIEDIDYAWQYLYRSSLTNAGRAHYDEYAMLGFVPGEVSLSLNYYLSDYVVSVVARELGYIEEADKLGKRSRNWKLLFDKDDSKMFVAKNKDGSFDKFSEFKWMGPYREGGPWQYRFYVPHDIKELNKWGYDGNICDYLNKMMTHNYKPRITGSMIHEEKELYNHMFGQYSHNNQPVHHIPYLFHHVGCYNDGAQWIRKILEESYTKSGYPGDEDNGEMSAWYILSSIGLYSLIPGTLEYQISSKPLWDHVDIDNGRIIIESSGNDSPIVNKITVNDQTSKNINYNSNFKYRIKIK